MNLLMWLPLHHAFGHVDTPVYYVRLTIKNGGWQQNTNEKCLIYCYRQLLRNVPFRFAGVEVCDIINSQVIESAFLDYLQDTADQKRHNEQFWILKGSYLTVSHISSTVTWNLKLVSLTQNGQTGTPASFQISNYELQQLLLWKWAGHDRESPCSEGRGVCVVLHWYEPEQLSCISSFRQTAAYSRTYCVETKWVSFFSLDELGLKCTYTVWENVKETLSVLTDEFN